MNPQNLSKVIEINQKLENIDTEITSLESQYRDMGYQAKYIAFDDNTSFLLSKDDLATLIQDRRARREMLMRELEKL